MGRRGWVRGTGGTWDAGGWLRGDRRDAGGRAAPRGPVPLSGAASSPALAPSRFHVSDFKGGGLRGSFI